MKIRNAVLTGTFGLLSVANGDPGCPIPDINDFRTLQKISCDGVVQLQPPDGYVYIKRAALANLNYLPVDLLADARLEYNKKHYQKAALYIHSAAQQMRILAASNIQGSHVLDAADNLDKLSRRVAKLEVKAGSDLDTEFAEAAKLEAKHHYLLATQVWAKNMTNSARTAIAHALNAAKKASLWTGQEIASGGKWSETEVKDGISAIGKEISLLDKKTDTTEKETK